MKATHRLDWVIVLLAVGFVLNLAFAAVALIGGAGIVAAVTFGMASVFCLAQMTLCTTLIAIEQKIDRSGVPSAGCPESVPVAGETVPEFLRV